MAELAVDDTEPQSSPLLPFVPDHPQPDDILDSLIGLNLAKPEISAR